MPKVSVVMSVYNGQSYLNESMESILSQSFKDFEFLIINDGSTDRSQQIIESYKDERIKWVINPVNLGLTSALNKAAAISRGDYIARQDADDVSLPERLKTQVEFLEANPAVALAGANFFMIDPEGRILNSSRLPQESRMVKNILLEKNCFAHSAIMFRKAAFIKAGGYNNEFKYAQDYDLYLRLSEIFDLVNLPQSLIKWRLNPRGVSVAKNREQEYYRLKAQRACRIRRGNAEGSSAFQGQSRFFKEDAGSVMSKYYHSLGRGRFYFGFHYQARQLFKKAILFSPAKPDNYLFFGLTFLPVRLASVIRRVKNGRFSGIGERHHTGI